MVFFFELEIKNNMKKWREDRMLEFGNSFSFERIFVIVIFFGLVICFVIMLVIVWEMY